MRPWPLAIVVAPAMTTRIVFLMLALTFSHSLFAQYWTRMPTDDELQAAAESFVQETLTNRQQQQCHVSTGTSHRVVRLHHQTDPALFLAHIQLTLTTTRHPWDFRARACDESAVPSTTSDDFYAVLMQDGQSGRFFFGTSLSSLPDYLQSYDEGWDVKAPTTNATEPALGRYRATIQIPPLTPGDVLSPSVDVVDENGKPPSSSIYVSWFINGVNTPSVVWDGGETRVEVQVSVDNQAVVAAVVIPAATPGDAPVSAAPASTAPSGPADGPVPGMTGAGPLPGPGSLGQALIGSLLPPLMIAIGQLLGGIRGGRTLPQGPVPPTPKPPPSKQPKAPSPKLPPDPAAAWKQRLDRLEQVARHDRNPQLAAAVQAVRGQLGGPRDPKAWAAAQQQLKGALGTLDQHLPKPNGAAWDAAASVVRGVRNTAVQAGTAISGAGAGALAFPGQVWQGLKGLGDGLLHPGHFVTGVNSMAKDWISKNLKTESQTFVQGLKDGKVTDALGALGQGMVKAAGSVLGAAWEKIGKTILPVDELKSFTDPHASLEEKLWAVPAAAVKIAGILVGLQKPSTQPSTAWGEAIQQGLKRPVPAPPPTIAVQPKPKLPGPTRPRPAVPDAPAAAPATPQPAAKSSATSTPAAPTQSAATPKKRYFQTTTDGSEIEIVPPSEITPSNHSSVVGDISLESASRAQHYRFFKVDRSGIRMMEPGAGVEDLCDVMLPKNKRPWEITDTDIIVCTSDKDKAARIRAQVKRHLELKGPG